MENLAQKQVKSDANLKKVWFNCKSQIANSIDISEKEAWLDNIDLIEFGKEQMVLGGLNTFFCNWNKNYQIKIFLKDRRGCF